MVLKQITGPVNEPLDIDEVKTHCRLDDVDIRGTMDDFTLESLIKVAREYVESLCGPMITQTWEQYESEWPAGDSIRLGKSRIQSVASLTYTDSDSVTTTLSTTYYSVDDENEYFPAIVLNYNYAWPASTLHPVNPIKITFTCGYGDTADDVPESLRHAMMLLIAHWYENREPVLVAMNTANALPVPMTVDFLLANYRAY